MTDRGALIARLAPHTLTGRFALIMGLAIAPLFLVGILLAAKEMKEARAERLDEFEQQVRSSSLSKREEIILIEQGLRTSARHVAESLSRAGDCEDAIAQIQSIFDWMTRARVFNKYGRQVCGGDENIDLSGRASWVRFDVDPKLTFGEVAIGQISGMPILLALLPLPGGDDEKFALAVGVDLEHIAQNTRMDGLEVRSALLNADGDVISLSALEEGENAADWLPRKRRALLTLGDRRIGAQAKTGEETVFITSELVDGQIWSIVRAPLISDKDIWLSLDGVSMFLPILFCVVVFLVSSLAARHLIAVHINRLRAVTKRISEGDARELERSSLRSAPREVRLLEETLRAMSRDLLDRNEALRVSNDMHKRLLLEIHHRVKNNLQTISSLISLENRRVSDLKAKRVFQTFRNRLYGISSVHQHLYAAERLDIVNVSQLINDISRHLHATLRASSAQAPPTLELANLDVDTVMATPIALFVTEAISNAYKHGDKDDPEVSILLETSDSGFSIRIENWIDKTEASAQRESEPTVKKLGWRLMSGFAQQLGGAAEQHVKNKRHVVTISASISPKRRLEGDLFTLRSAA